MQNFIKRYLSMHFMIWVIFPALLISSLPLDVVEIISWGNEWQWGYYKHPPLPAWLLYPSYRLFGNLGPFLLSQLSIAMTLGCVYLLGRRLLNQERAIFGCFALLGIFYFTWPTLEFNHNLGQMPTWAACVLLFERALATWSWPFWLGLGAMAAMSFLMKYSTLMLLASMFIYMLVVPELRRRLFDKKIFAALAVMIFLLIPHLIWLKAHHFLPLHYAADRAVATQTWTSGLSFLLAQLLDHLPLILVLAVVGLLRPSCWGESSKNIKFLLVLGLGPALLTALGATFSGASIHDMWGVPMWNLSGLLIAAAIKPQAIHSHLSRFIYTMAAMVLLISLGMVAYLSFGDHFQKNPSRTSWPAKEIATSIDNQWDKLSSCPLKIVSGNYWLDGLIAIPSRYKPSVFISNNKDYSPWISQKTMDNYGWISVWEDNEPAPNLKKPDNIERFEGQMTFSWPGGRKTTPLILHWEAFIPKGCVRQ